MHWLGEVAAQENARLYLVGGMIRDRLLGRKTLDIDLACDGPVKKLAARLAAELGTEFHYHSAFKTAHMEGPKGARIDIAMTRTETYAESGELPRVKRAGIDKDLYRRDFTINAMAQALHPDDFGIVIDPLNGKKDIEKRLIRVIHDKSFIDDPTRIFRAVRYKQRIQGIIEPRTAELMKKAVPRIKDLSGERLLYELRCIMGEERDVRLTIVKKLATIRALDFLGPPPYPVSYARIARLRTETSCEFLCLLFSYFKAKFVSRLPLKKGCKETIATLREKKHIYQRLAPLASPSKITFFLSSFDPRGLRIISEVDPGKNADKITKFLDDYGKVTIKTTGDDLKKLGMSPGPGYKEILEKLLAARLDGKIKTVEDERNMLMKLVRTQ